MTNKLVWANFSTDQKSFTGHMFNIKLEEKSYKISFKALPVKIQPSKNRQEGGGGGEKDCTPPPRCRQVEPNLVQCFIFIPPENIRKHFQEICKWDIQLKWVNKTSLSTH